MKMIKKCILNFLILLIVNSQTYSNSITYTDSLIIFINNDDINKNNLILSNGDTINCFKLRFEVIAEDSITTLINDLNGMYPKNGIINQKYPKNYKLLINNNIAYFALDSQKIDSTKFKNYFLTYLIIGFLIKGCLNKFF